jgi:hypothetical protein
MVEQARGTSYTQIVLHAARDMETKPSVMKSETVRDVLSGGVAILLMDYFRLRLHEWLRFSHPLSAAVGTLLAWGLVWLICGAGRMTNRAFFIKIITISLLLNFVGTFYRL